MSKNCTIAFLLLVASPAFTAGFAWPWERTCKGFDGQQKALLRVLASEIRLAREKAVDSAIAIAKCGERSGWSASQRESQARGLLASAVRLERNAEILDTLGVGLDFDKMLAQARNVAAEARRYKQHLEQMTVNWKLC